MKLIHSKLQGIPRVDQPTLTLREVVTQERMAIIHQPIHQRIALQQQLQGQLEVEGAVGLWDLIGRIIICMEIMKKVCIPPGIH